MFRGHRWPGNVREVANAVQRLLVSPHRAFSLGQAAPAETRPDVSAPAPVRPLRVARRESTDGFERDYLQSLLARAEGSVTRAAAIAEVSRQMIHKMLRKHGMVYGLDSEPTDRPTR
jgi:DNA-binding NtrC family response regulator